MTVTLVGWLLAGGKDSASLQFPFRSHGCYLWRFIHMFQSSAVYLLLGYSAFDVLS